VVWRLVQPRSNVRLLLRPFLSGRDYHALHRENPAFRFQPEQHPNRWRWQPYPTVPAVLVAANGAYRHEPDWFRNFHYAEESARGLDDIEDLASPGTFHFDLSKQEAVWLLAAEGWEGNVLREEVDAVSCLRSLADAERKRRAGFVSRLHRSAADYLVRRGPGQTIVAGYPWFTDWGRDTFIALCGLCLATGRLDDAGQILDQWAGTVTDGMLPNRFPDHGDRPEFNAVDASLWFILAVHDYLQRAADAGPRSSRLQSAVEAILDGYLRGTRFGIHVDTDGLVAAGVPGLQLTWMDARVGNWVVTPRIGKPVEVQALWLNALAAAGRFSDRWREHLERGRQSFAERFWNPAEGCLYDVVDADHQPGAVDAAFRPNQVLAVGGLPLALLEQERARRVVEGVESRLWTPLGLRSLAPGSPGYAPRYQGNQRQRDAAYHQGTVWPWLMGPFVQAWLRVRGHTAQAKAQARRRFLQPLLAHLDQAGLGHVSEIADADPPHTPRGCPFQAWSLGELVRLELELLADDASTRLVGSPTDWEQA
jgi:predicted glycogen debranching enzyme